MMRPPILLSTVAALVLSGCSPDAREYEELSGLRAAVASAGVACASTDPGPEARLVTDSGTCSDSGLSLYLFDSEEDLQDWRKVGTRLGRTLIGPNWAVTGEQEDIDRIAAELGGEVANPAD